MLSGEGVLFSGGVALGAEPLPESAAELIEPEPVWTATWENPADDLFEFAANGTTEVDEPTQEPTEDVPPARGCPSVREQADERANLFVGTPDESAQVRAMTLVQALPAAPGVTSSTAQELVETLRAANGPPSYADSVIHLTPDSTASVGQELLLNAGEVLSGNGGVGGAVVNCGVVTPGNSPGIINVAEFTQSAEGVTVIEIGGTAGPGVDPNGWDQINVAGKATLNGTLQIQLYGGFVPSLGNSFQVFTWGSVDGEFSRWLGTASIPEHSDWCFRPDYSSTGLTLTVVQTPTLIAAASTAITTGLGTLANVGDALDGLGGFAETLPLIGSSLANLADSGAAITNAIRNRLSGLLGTLPRVSQVTAAIEGWDGTNYGGFTADVKGVLAHFGAGGTQPVWWDVSIELAPASVNRALQNALGGVFGAVFSGTPSVSVNGAVVLDVALGYESGPGFFVEIHSAGARAQVSASGLGGFGFNFDTPAGAQNLAVNSGTVVLDALVLATPDDSILTGGRITQATLAGLSSANIGNAFNLSKSGSLNAAFPLTGSLNFIGFALSGTYVVRIRSEDLFVQAPELSVEVASTLTVMGQTLNGTFTFRNTGTQTVLEATNVNLQLGAGASRVLSVQNGSGTFLLVGGELAGVLVLDFALGPAIPNISMSAAGLRLALNTSNGDVPDIAGTAVNLPAGPYYRVSGHGAISLANPQAGLDGDLVFEPRDADSNPGNGYEEVAVGVANLAFGFTDGTSPILNVTDGSGAFVFRSSGMVGSLSANANLAVSALALSGTFSVALNTMATSYNQSINVSGTTVMVNVPAGPFLRVTGSGASLTLQSVGVTGDFTFERRQTTTGGEWVVTMAASGMALDLGATASNLLTVTGGNGAFIIAGSGMSGTATASVSLNVPGVTLSGSFTVRVNDSTSAVDETVSVGGSDLTINLPAGPYLQVSGTGLSLGFLGVSLIGNFSFEQRTSKSGSRMITVAASSVGFNFGTSLLSASDGNGFFVMSDAGIAGKGTITVHVNTFGTGFSHTFDWAFNTTGIAVNQVFGNPTALDLPAGPFNKIDSGPMPISINVPIGSYTQSISGRFIVTLVNGTPGYLTVAASGVNATIGSGAVSLTVSDGAGAFVVYSSGMAGEIRVNSASLTNAGALSITGQNLKLRLNNTGGDVGAPSAVVVPINDNPADNVSIQFSGPYYHNYLAVSGTAEIGGIVGSVVLGGNFVIERARIDTNNDAILEDVFKLGVTDLHFSLNAGSVKVVSFDHGTGALILSGAGLAAEADLQFEAGLVGLSGTMLLKLNTTGGAVTNASVTTPAGTHVLNLASGNYIQVNVDGHLHIGSFALPFQLIVKVSGGGVEFRRAGDNELLVAVSGSGEITLGAPLASLANFDFARASPIEWVVLLRQLGQWFDSLRDSSLFDVEIPFTDGVTLGEAFDWSKLFFDSIYKYMVSVELQSRSMFDTTVHNGALSGAVLRIQLGEETPLALTISDSVGDTNSRDGNELKALINSAIAVAALSGRLVARINKDKRVVIALTEDEVAKGTTLNLVDADAVFAELGFGPGDGDEDTPDQVGVLTERWSTEDFFAALADILNDGILDNDGGVSYDPRQQVYAYQVNISADYDTSDLFGSATLPFKFNLGLGPIADAELTGALEFNAHVGFTLTLGFDLGAADVPRVLTSSLVPVPANGRISANAHFGIYLNESEPNPTGSFSQLFPLELQAASTAGNNSIDDLAIDLNSLFATKPYGSGHLSDVVIAQKAGNGLAISAKPNQLGVINRIIVISPKNDTFATEMGFGVEAQDLDGLDVTTQDQVFVSIAKSPMKGLFIDNAQLTGRVSVNTTAAGIDGTVRFGFVEINTSDGAFGTLAHDGTTKAPIEATLSIQNQTTGERRFYIAELLNNTSSNNISNLAPAFGFSGSFLGRLANITVGGLGFSFPLGSNPEISVWIPDIKELAYNPNPYDASTNNKGIFLTYPNLGNLQNFTNLNFTQITKALTTIADNLSQLSAFSFLDEPLPFVNISVNDMLDYASRFADLIDSAASGGSRNSLQETLTELERQIELLFNLDPGILTVSLDENGVSAAALVTAGGSAGAPSKLVINYDGYNNAFTIAAESNGAELNGSAVRIVGDSSITGASAQVAWDANARLLTVKINPGKTTASAIVTAINAISSPWNASLAPPDNDSGTNTGLGTITTAALKFSFIFSTAYANSLPFQLDLKDLLGRLAGDNQTVRSFLELATTLVQIKGEGKLTVSASAALTLDFGLDVSTPGLAKPFFYDTTGVELLAKVLGTNIDIEASLGSVFGIFIKNGRVTLDKDGDPDTGPREGDRGAEFQLGLKKDSGEGRYYFDENWFNPDSIDLRLEGGVSAQLPVFAPFESEPLGGGTDANGDGYPDNYLVVEIPDLVRLFISEAVSTTATGAQRAVKFGGLHNDILVKSDGTYTDFKIVFLDSLSGDSATASFNTTANTLTVNIDAGVTTALVARNAIKTATGSGNHFSPTDLTPDDDGNPATTTNDGSGKLEKLSIITPNFSALFDGLQICDVLANSIDEILAGLDKLLGWIEDGLNEVVYNVDLPLVGKGLKGAADFIGDIRSGLLRELREEIDAAGGNGLTAMENAIKKALWNSLGPGGLDWLVDHATGNPLDISAGFSQLDVTLDCETGLKVNIRIAKSIALLDTTENPIDFQIGVPGFGLEVDGNVVLSLGFDLKFGFGVDLTNGFYFNTSAPANDPELGIYFRAEIPGLHAAGQLLFLQLDVMDDPDSPSFFEGAFEVDLTDPNHDNKLTMAELFSSGTRFKDIIHAVLGAEADVNLNLIASFGGNTAFPRVLADFHLGWTFDTDNGAGDPRIAFTNIYLDLGTFISDFLGPVLKEVRRVTEPIQPIVDIVTARIPVISDLAGQTITLLDLAEVFGLLEPSTVDFIQGVIGVINLINKLDGLGEGTILIPFGSFSLLEGADGRRTNIQALETLASRTMDDIAAAAAAATGPGASSTYSSAVSGFASDVGSLSNFTIPIFDNPAELFNLFIGEPVRLVEWRMPTFKFKFTYTQKIPIYPPLYAQFGGTIGADINIGFGYDTYGIQKYISSEDKNWVDILDGFYVLDFDASGNEQPELRLYGELFAGASINLLIVEAGVRGGLGFELTFDLNDVNDDGKVRVSEIFANAQQDPRCIFDIAGRIYLFLEAFLKIDLFFFSIDKTWRFAEITLFSFEITCPEPVIAEFSPTDPKELLVNIGSRAPNRLEIDTTDESETFLIKHTGGAATDETVEVQWGNYKQTFEHVGHIVVPDAGQGDDYLDFRGILSPVEVHGGSGNDTIYLGDGNDSKAYGDDGNDTINASSNTGLTGVEIRGGAGNDVLIAGPSAIRTWGDAGADAITGSPDKDELYGDDGSGTSPDGDDTMEGGDGNDLIRGGLGNDTLEGGPGDDWIRGDGGNDIVRGSRGDDGLEGGPGDDKLYGSSGNDLLLGGAGSDWANGHGGTDLLIGDDDPANPITINGLAITQPNLDAIRLFIAAIPDDGIAVRNIPGRSSDALGNDILIGGGKVDAFFGGPGNDFLYGGNFLNNGETEPIEEDDNDFFDGGSGDDTIFGDDSMGKTGDRDTGIAIQSAVFFDLNKNGVKDADELGFGGVTVTLYRNDGLVIGAIKTEVDGAFKFTGLDPDRYYMTFSSVAGMDFIAQFGGGAADAEADGNDSDVYEDASKWRTPDFQLTFDETERNVTAGYGGDPIVSVNDVSVTEGNSAQSTVTLTVTLSGPQRTAVTLDYRTEDGNDLLNPRRNATAASGDYMTASGTLSFAAGETSKTISIAVLGDTTYEEHQQFRLVLSNPSAGIKLPTAPETTALVTITNDDPVPKISIADYVPPSTLLATGERIYTVPESTTAEFVISLSNPSEYEVSMWYLVDSGYDCGCSVNPVKPWPAYADGDYVQPAPAKMTFQPGETQRKITVQFRDDSLDEPDEQVYVDLFNPSYGRIDDGRAYGVIPDDDEPVSVSLHKPGDPPSFSTSINEGNTGYTSVNIEVTLSKISGKKITVTYATSPGTAVEKVYSESIGIARDYEPMPNDTMPEEDQSLVFMPGESSKTITVKVFGDTWPEPDELFFVNLISADNAVIAATLSTESNHFTVVIKNDDAVSTDGGPWSVFFGGTNYVVQEPDSGVAYAEITIHRTPGSSEPVAVFYTTNGTATAGADYGAVFRQVVYFAGSETTKVFRVPIYADDFTEGDETVLLSLRNPTGGKIRAAPDTATLNIRDTDLPVVSVSAPVLGAFFDIVTGHFTLVRGVDEGTSPGTTTATFTIRLDKGAPPGGVVVDWTTVSGTARAAQDFTAVSGTAFIPANNTSTTVDVTVTRDSLSELTEQFYVRLSSPVRATLSDRAYIARCPIYDDDLYPVEGVVFFDANGNGFLDIGEGGIADVSVTITWMQSGIHHQVPVKTDTSGKYTANVALGQVSIAVDGTTVKSPFQDAIWPLLIQPLYGSGSYANTTGNEVQSESFDGVAGISPFGPVGYKNSFSFTLPEKAKSVGRGGTDDTSFGGPGNDTIDAGAGDDHVIGGHWQTATDGHMPVNQKAYDAELVVVTDETNLQATYGLPSGTTLHAIYDDGPIFSVTPQLFPGTISGEIWLDRNPNNVQDALDQLFTKGVLVTLLDTAGNPVNAMFSIDGKYSFKNLFVDTDHPAAESKYVVQFELPEGYTFTEPNQGDPDADKDNSTTDNDAEFVNRTRAVAISASAPSKTSIDAGVTTTSALALGGTYQFSRGTYSVSEAKPGYVDIIVTRSNTYTPGVVVVKTADGTGPNGAKSAPPDTRNYEATVAVLIFDLGEQFKTFRIPVFNRHLAFTEFRYFTLTLNDATGRPYDTAAVCIVGEANPTITDDDTIQGGSDWDIILGDSGNIPGYAVVAEYPDIGARAKLGDIVLFGGPGKDTIDAAIGADYIDGQLGDDIVAGGEGVDIVIGGLGDDQITVGQGDDDIRGDYGTDTVISVRAVPGVVLTPMLLTHQQIQLGAYVPLNEHKLHDIFEMAELFGDSQANRFQLKEWTGTAVISGGGGRDSLLVTSNTDMLLKDATFVDKVVFWLLFGLSKDASINLPAGASYHLASLENVTLSGGAAANKIDASGYSRPVTFVATPGNDTYIGGTGNDTFAFLADAPLDTITATGNAGADTLSFAGTVAGVKVDLTTVSGTQPANINLVLVLKDDFENVTGGSGDDFLYGNALDNVLLGGPGNDWLEGRGGSETYVFDTDEPWGNETVVEQMGDAGTDVLDFSGTTIPPIQLNMGLLDTFQTVNDNLQLRLKGEGIEEVFGGALGDIIRGNGNDNILHGGAGNDLLDGKGGDDLLDGGPGNDTLLGGEGSDKIDESANADFVLTNAKLVRGLEEDTLDSIEIAFLTGGRGANSFTLTGWTGSGRINGAGGIDTGVWAADADFILTDVSLKMSLASAPIDLVSIERATLTGGPGNNTMDAAGFSGRATLIGNEGDDVLLGGAGADVLRGGPGNNTLTGNRGNDVINGGTGSNSMIEALSSAVWKVDFVLQNQLLFITQRDPTPFPTDDSITEADSITGIGTVKLIGSPQDDTLDISGWTAGSVNFDGAGGIDTIELQVPVPPEPPPQGGIATLTDVGIEFTGSASTISLTSIEEAILTGTDRDDILDASAFAGTAWIYAKGGNDVLKAGPGANWLEGGDGDDRFVFAQDGMAVMDLNAVIGGNADGTDRGTGTLRGMDTLDLSAFAVGVSVNLGSLGSVQTAVSSELDLYFAFADIEGLIGGSGNDTLIGSNLNNEITGGPGQDIINGGGGFNTTVETADANFVLTDSSLTVAGATDALSNIQKAVLTGGHSDNSIDASGFSGQTNLTGLAGNDVLIGGSGDDALVGGAGDDTLIGNIGNDTYKFDVDEALGADIVIELAGAGFGFDVLDFSPTTTTGVSIDVSLTTQQIVHGSNLKLTLSDGSAVECLVGTAQADVLIGNSTDNVLIGGLGDDVMFGNGGLINTVYETRNDDFRVTDTSLEIGTETDTLIFVQNVVLIGGESNNVLDATGFSGTAWLFGMEGNDTLYGGSGNDSVNGGDGNDILRGNGGSDDLQGGRGNDTYVFDLSFDQGADIVREFSGEGYADTLLGIGPSGLVVDLHTTALQTFTNLKLTMAAASTVEFSF